MPLASIALEVFSVAGEFLHLLYDRLRRHRFNRKYGPAAYDALYGPDLRAFLDREYGQQNWSWQMKLLDVNREQSVFEVQYDDCGAWAGVVAVAPHRPLPERYRILRKEERAWPPPDWA